MSSSRLMGEEKRPFCLTVLENTDETENRLTTCSLRGSLQSRPEAWKQSWGKFTREVRQLVRVLQLIRVLQLMRALQLLSVLQLDTTTSTDTAASTVVPQLIRVLQLVRVPQLVDSLRRRANARNVGLRIFYGG